MITNVIVACRQTKDDDRVRFDEDLLLKRLLATTYAEKQIIDTLSRLPKIETELKK